jgi:hypothetical protein
MRPTNAARFSYVGFMASPEGGGQPMYFSTSTLSICSGLRKRSA